MSRSFILWALVSLCSCTAQKSEPSAQSSRFETNEQVEAGGLSPKDIAALHLFLRHAFSQTGLNYSGFSKTLDPNAFCLLNEHGLRLGVIYSYKKDALWLIDPDRLSSYDELQWKKAGGGYQITLIQGCIHSEFKVSVLHGKLRVVE